MIMRLNWLLGLLIMLGFGGCYLSSPKVTVEDVVVLSKFKHLLFLKEDIKEDSYNLLGSYGLIDLLSSIQNLQYDIPNFSFDEKGQLHLNFDLSQMQNASRETNTMQVFSMIQPFTRSGRGSNICHIWNSLYYTRVDINVAVAMYLWMEYTNANYSNNDLMNELIFTLDYYFLFAQREQTRLEYDGLVCCLLYHSFSKTCEGRLLTREMFLQKNTSDSIALMEKIVMTPNWIDKVILLLLGIPIIDPFDLKITLE